MATNVTFNSVNYSIPAEGDNGWGPDLTAYFISLAANTFQKSGGSFTLTSEVNFGATYGLKSAYIKSQAANPASAGYLKLGNTEAVAWRNNANSGDLLLSSNSSDALIFNSKNILFSGLALIVNADINAAAAIAYSKLNLTGQILNADLAGSIAYSKLVLTGAVVNADLATGIDAVKIADGSVTNAEFQFINSLTSNAQTQINTKAPTSGPTFTGLINNSGGQIEFPATENPSANVNTLDDYKESTFTPIVLGSTTAGVGTYTTQVGSYTKIGNMVFFQLYVLWSGLTGTGNLKVGGLPYTTSATANSYSAVSIYASSITLSAINVIMGATTVNDTTIDLFQYASGGGAATTVPVDTAGELIISGHYKI